MCEKKIQIQQEKLYKINFPDTQLYFTLSTYVTPKTIPRHNQKNEHNTRTVWYSKYISSM
jgi:hypothetical protein